MTSVSNPLGASSAGEIGNLYTAPYNLLKSDAATNATVNQAQVDVATANRAHSEAVQREKDMQNASKYRVVQRKDGGYGFYDPNGKEVSAADYANIAGKSPAAVLKGSQNPIDAAFQQDYKQIEGYFNDKLNSKLDPNAKKRAENTEALVKQNYPSIDLAKQDHNQLIKTFMQAYPTVFGLHTTGVQGTNALLPNNEALKNASLYGLNSSNGR